jgi:hypothetical protein
MIQPQPVTLHALWRWFLHFMWRSDKRYAGLLESENFAGKISLTAMCGKRANDMTRTRLCPNGNITVCFGQS